MKHFFACSVFLLFSLQGIARSSAEKLHCPSISDDEERNTRIGRQYFTMGNGYHETKDYLKAIESFECVLRFVPYSLNARYKLALAYDQYEFYSKAREYYELILVFDSPEAESLKPDIRKRLAEIKDLKDRVKTVQVRLVEPEPDRNVCHPLVLKSMQETLTRMTRNMDARDWLTARKLFEESQKNLDGATADQRQLCMATEPAQRLYLLGGIAHFHLGNLQTARELFTIVFRQKSDMELPTKYANAKLMAFYQEVLTAFFQVIKEERERQLRLRQLEESHQIPAEPSENPASPLEHEPPADIHGKAAMFLCRVQDQIGAVKVTLVYRKDGGPVQEESLEKLGRRRYVTVLPEALMRFSKFEYYLVAHGSDGSPVAQWGSLEKPHVFTHKADPKDNVPLKGPGAEPEGKTGDVSDKPPVEDPSPILHQVFRRFFFSAAIGFGAGHIAEGMPTINGARTDNDSFGKNSPQFVIEAGWYMTPHQRLSLQFGYNPFFEYELIDSNAHNDPIGPPPIKSQSEVPFWTAIRWAYEFGTGFLRPFIGFGLAAGELNHEVETFSHVFDRPIVDMHTMSGFYTDIFLGLQVCLDDTCRFGLKGEFKTMWNFVSHSDDYDDHTSNFLLYVNFGATFRF